MTFTSIGVFTEVRTILTYHYIYWHSLPSLTESFDSKLTDAGNPLVRQLGRHLRLPRAVWRPSRSTEEGECTAGKSRPILQCGQVDATSTTQTLLGYSVFRDFSQLQSKCQDVNEKGHGSPTTDQRGLQPKWSPPKCRRGLQPKRVQFWVQFQSIHSTKGLLLVGIIPHKKKIQKC